MVDVRRLRTKGSKPTPWTWAVVLALLTASAPLFAQVTRDAGTFAELQAAVTASAASGDTINITNDIVVTAATTLDKSLTINGNGRLLTVPVPGLDESGVQTPSPSTFRVFLVSGSGTVVTINDLTLRGGLPSGGTTNAAAGGAVQVAAGATLVLRQSTIERSRSTWGGGGIAAFGAVFIDRTRVLRNSARFGGGFNVFSGVTHVDRSVVAENRSEASNGGGGGGSVTSAAATLYVNNTTFSNNQSTEIGGGLANSPGGTMYVLNSTFSGNVGYGGLVSGGAIGINGGTVRMVNNLFAYNYVRSAGTVTNPTAFILSDVAEFNAGSTSEARFNIFHATNTIDTTSDNIQYPGAADGSDNTIFSGGLLARITDGTGTEIGTAEVFRPFLVQTSDGRSATLEVGSFATDFANFPARRGTPTGYANTPSPVAGYFNGSAWVTWVGGDASTVPVAIDQLGDSRTAPDIVRGSASREVDNVFILRVNRAAGGTVSGGSLYGDVYSAGAAISLGALPDAGQRFVGWQCVVGCAGTASNDNPYSFAMPANNLSLEPVFAAQAAGDFTVTYSGNGNTSGSPPASQTSNAAVIIAGSGTLVRTGYTFTGWNTVATGGGTDFAPGASYGFTGAPNLTLFAQWQFTPPVTVPGAPTIGTATAGDGQAAVTFTAPASNGGAAITGYTVTSNPGGLTGTGSGSPITVTGLTNGVAYTFTVTATNSAGTGAASAASNAVTPQSAFSAPAARPDRALAQVGGSALDIDVLANDTLEPALRSAAVLSIVRLPAIGNASVSGTGIGQRIRYVPPSAPGVANLRYRICTPPVPTCAEAEIQIDVRPVAVSALQWTTDAERGFRDIPVSGLPALPAARFNAFGLSVPVVRTVQAVDIAGASEPWAGGRQATTLRTLPVSTAAATWRILVDATASAANDVDLFLGIDSNANGLADPSELACSSAMAISERCDLTVEVPAGQTLSYWALVRMPQAGDFARIELFETPTAGPAAASRALVATGPGIAVAGASFPLRLVWEEPTLLPGQSRGGWVELLASDGVSLGWVPVRIDRVAGSPTAFALASGFDHAIALPDGVAHERLFIDVPPGSTRLEVSAQSDGFISLYLSRVPAGAPRPETPLIERAPARAEAVASAATPAANQQLSVDLPAPGRWYVTPVNAPLASNARIVVRATVIGSGPRLAPGGFFNPMRAGSGLFIYPTASEWVGLWFTSVQDGSPTWYYLQAAEPGGNGVWRSPIFRSAWNGATNRLTAVGEATVTPDGTGGFTFSYTLDGQTGSEAFRSFGGGCPTVGGQPLQASGLWFDPATAGSGYAVQFFPNYEFHLVFGYDSEGVPRYLNAERQGFGAAEQAMDLNQLTGACPLCERTGDPQRARVGTLTRTITGGTLTRFMLDATYLNGVPGTWAANDAVIPLAELQSCSTN